METIYEIIESMGGSYDFDKFCALTNNQYNFQLFMIFVGQYTVLRQMFPQEPAVTLFNRLTEYQTPSSNTPVNRVYVAQDCNGCGGGAVL